MTITIQRVMETGAFTDIGWRQCEMGTETYVRVLNEWVELHRRKSQENDTYECLHGHVNCSTHKNGRCLDETLIQIDRALEKLEV